MQEIVITARGDTLDAPFDPHFGRAAKLLVCDPARETCYAIDNGRHAEAAQGAGLQVAQGVLRLGAKAVITGACGPKAMQVLSTAGVAVYSTQAATAAEALAQFLAGMLDPIGTDAEAP